MALHRTIALIVLACSVSQSLSLPSPPAGSDPCAVIGGKKWVSPSDVRACFLNYPFNDTLRQNAIDVMEKLLPFHPSMNYQIQAPEPFAREVHLDLYAELDRMRHQNYDTDFAFNLDMINTFNKARDQDFKYSAWCYDSRFNTVIPTPIVLITEESGEQAVYIAPEAFTMASTNYPEQIPVWQAALPSGITLESLSGAKVLSIDGKDPIVAVNASADLNGDYESIGIRQNAFFGSYSMIPFDSYYFGDFAAKPLPLVDSVTMVIQRQNFSTTDTVTIPYRSYLQKFRDAFTDSASFRADCLSSSQDNQAVLDSVNPDEREVMSTTGPQPRSSTSQMLPRGVSSLNHVANFTFAQIYVLEDGVTGVMAIGRFRPTFQESEVQKQFLDVFLAIKEKGVKRLIIDVSNGFMGRLCTSIFFHRLFAGASPTTEPNAGLDFKMRAGPLAKLIVQRLAEGGDQKFNTQFNSANYLFPNQTRMPAGYNYMADATDEIINGRPDSFTQRIGGGHCPDIDVSNGTYIDLPKEPLFDLKNVVILTNGRTVTASAFFTTLMAKREGVRTVVAGGRAGVLQDYSGSGSNWTFGSWPIYQYVKDLGLEEHPLAPPKPLTTIGLEFPLTLYWGINDPSQPERWQDHSATINFPLTLETVNNPPALWKDIAAKVF